MPLQLSPQGIFFAGKVRDLTRELDQLTWRHPRHKLAQACRLELERRPSGGAVPNRSPKN